ncbi:LysR family transcriptional regulator [Pseudovibrio exalbescens]|uniref:LysR family transcriptional regulator n=1 Tax=Pseudovibrio exalbescens TaxID=197461 RepID=UPI002366D857|nr:LysR family transcriptional regulator [Pseudovibrio exalbescens]MDD7910782.1 LysR family transcriptional regulator [Pseudovibrio exalbescens]
MRYDLNAMRTFVTLLEERSVSRAAERLGITQPALSNSLARLRELLQDPLFVRERYGMRPTEKAETIGPVIAEALRQIDGVVQAQQDFDPLSAHRHFVIAANSYVEFILIPDLMARLRELAPHISIRVIPFGASISESGLMSGDTAFALGRMVDPPDNLVVHRLFEDGLHCVVRADLPGIGDRLTKQHYENLKHVNVLPPGTLKAGLFQVLEREGLHRDLAASLTHFLSVPDLIAATDYCATLPDRVCERLKSDPRLKIVAPPVDLGRFPVELAWHSRYRTDPAHRWLRRLITKTFGEL